MVLPTAYLSELCALVQETEPELWNFFASAPRTSALVEEVRANLLRSAYRLDDSVHVDVLEAAALAAESLGLDDPVTLYQAQDGGGGYGNAACLSIPGQVHVVFSGATLSLLDGDELVAVMGHELAHHVLWSLDGGAYWILDRLVHASAEDLGARASHEETARLLRLNTELVADRGAHLAVDGDTSVTISALVKLATGLSTVSGEAYLRQSEEILAAAQEGVGPSSHPETYVRAWALARWVAEGEGAEEAISRQLTGTRTLNTLDLVAQHRLTELSQRLVRQWLEPAWSRTDPLLAHAKAFGGLAVPRGRGKVPAPVTATELASWGTEVGDYVSYVLLDLATVDGEVAEPAMAASLVLSDELGLPKPFDAIVRKELGITVKDLRDRRTAAPALLVTAATS